MLTILAVMVMGCDDQGYKRDIVKGDWTNDNMGIRSLYTTLNGLDDDDVVMGGDADEIPSGDALMFWRHFKGDRLLACL